MKKLYCITCPVGCQLTVTSIDYEIIVEGNKCEKGIEFAEDEMTNPTRTLTTTVRTKFPGVPVISVRTDGEIPKDTLMKAMHELSKVVIEEEMDCGDVVLEDIAETGVSVIVTSAALMRLGEELENKNVELGRRGGGGTVSAAEDSDVEAGAGIGVVRNSAIADEIGEDAVGGFVGAAGEAVGVEDAEDEQETSETEDEQSSGYIKQKSRPHIKRN